MPNDPRAWTLGQCAEYLGAGVELHVEKLVEAAHEAGYEHESKAHFVKEEPFSHSFRPSGRSPQWVFGNHDLLTCARALVLAMKAREDKDG